MSDEMIETMKDYGIDPGAMEEAVSRVGYSLQAGADTLLKELFADMVTVCVDGEPKEFLHDVAIKKVDLLRKIPGIVDTLYDERNFVDTLYDERNFIVRSDAVGIGGGIIWFIFFCADDACCRASIRLTTININ
jgi:hypothetical protein